MKLDFKDLPARITPLFNLFRKYVVLIFFIALCGVYGFLTYRISTLTEAEPLPEAVAEKLKAVSRPRIDKEAVEKMTQLEEENIDARALFEEARNNPFSE